MSKDIPKRGHMEGKNRQGFHTVKEADMKEYHQKLKEHRLHMMKRSVMFAVILLMFAAGLWLFMTYRQYRDYDVRSSVERSDARGTKFVEFQRNILKYSIDGAFYTDEANELIWNQTFEMSSPQIDICEEYLTIYDKKGTGIYIFTSSKLQGSIETTMPIEQVCIASQGTIAVLMRKDDTAYLELYNKEGDLLASGEIHGKKGGYPVAIALSHDAIKLGISMLDISAGQVSSTVAFYNYSSIGQNEIDNCVGVTTYENMVIPELEFTSNNRMVAYGDSKLLIFEGTQKPVQTAEITLEKQAQSIFHNNDYIGIVYNNEDEEVTHHLSVYKTNGDLVRENDFSAEYDTIQFMSNNEICILTDTMCNIYTLRGVFKFQYEFEEGIYQVIPGGIKLNYTLVLGDATERIRLK